MKKVLNAIDINSLSYSIKYHRLNGLAKKDYGRINLVFEFTYQVDFIGNNILLKPIKLKVLSTSGISLDFTDFIILENGTIVNEDHFWNFSAELRTVARQNAINGKTFERVVSLIEDIYYNHSKKLGYDSNIANELVNFINVSIGVDKKAPSMTPVFFGLASLMSVILLIGSFSPIAAFLFCIVIGPIVFPR